MGVKNKMSSSIRTPRQQRRVRQRALLHHKLAQYSREQSRAAQEQAVQAGPVQAKASSAHRLSAFHKSRPLLRPHGKLLTGWRKPENLPQLLSYLREHPYLRVECTRPRLPAHTHTSNELVLYSESRLFLRVAPDRALVFRTPRNTETRLSIHNWKTLYRADHFHVQCLHPLRYFYLHVG
jgi:hypothetical protein